MDGTLVDSEQSWLEAIRAYALEANQPLSDQAVESFRGVSVDDASRELVHSFGIDATEAEVSETLEQRSIDAFPGRLRWLREAENVVHRLRAEGTPVGLVTSSTRRWLSAVQEHLSLGEFDVVVTADDVALTKPNPDPYIQAAASLGIPTESCVVFEDSPVGLQAGLDAGCRVVRVGSAQGFEACDTSPQISSFAAVNTEWLRSLLASGRTFRPTPQI